MEKVNKISSSILCPPQNEQAFKQFQIATARALQFEPGFVIDNSNRQLIKILCLYFSNDVSFEKEGFGHLNKGLFLTGNVGAGKTTLMRSFAENEKRRYHVTSTSHITQRFMQHGIECLEDYLGNVNPMYGGPAKSYCFDDIGVECISAKYMGNEQNVMEQIILSRYEKRIPFYFTHFTSNLTGDQIEKLYGTRVRSRLREMTNFIVMDGSDRRK